MKKTGVKALATNKKAYHDFFIEEVYEAGIALIGTEVKSVRMGSCNLKDSYARVRNGEVFVTGMHISPYEKGNIFNADPMRDRKLLLHKREIFKLRSASEKEGYSLVPLKLYLKDGKVKVELGVAKGKKLYDKRESIARKDTERDMERMIKEKNM